MTLMAQTPEPEEERGGTQQAHLKDEKKTELNASVLLASPISSSTTQGVGWGLGDPWAGTIPVGLYQLEGSETGEEAAQVRTGGLQFFKVSSSEGEGGAEAEAEANQRELALRPAQVAGGANIVETGSGVFEIKWFHRRDLHTRSLAVAKACGEVSVHEVTLGFGGGDRPDRPTDSESDAFVVERERELCSASLTEGLEGVFCLCVDVAAPPQGGDSPPSKLAASTSDGRVHLLSCDAGTPDLRVALEWQAHDLEPWSVCFHAADPNLVYTGADDSFFQAWDCRQGGGGGAAVEVEAEAPGRRWVNRSAHGAGVCCVRTHRDRENLVATGSYDEHVRFWDVRMPRRPLAELCAGGGVWRMDWCERDPSLLVTAGMQGGCRVLRVEGGGGSLEEQGAYLGHGSIAYGAGFLGLVGEGGGESLLAASCSFYDNQVHLWGVPFVRREEDRLGPSP